MAKKHQKTNKNFALDTFVKLLRASETISALVHSNLTEKSLTISQFGVLEALFHLGPMCQKELAQKILKSSGNMTMVIDNLEKRNLVARRKDQDDRRYYSIHLTEAGKEVISAIFPDHLARINKVMSVLNEKEQKKLGSLCKKFKKNIIQEE